MDNPFLFCFDSGYAVLYFFVSAVFYTDSHLYFAYAGAFMVHYNHLFESFLVAVVFRWQCCCFLCSIEDSIQLKHIPPQQIIHEYTLLYPSGISQPVTIYSEGAEKIVVN